MDSGSIIIVGIFSAILLIFTCITLKAPKFYNELGVSSILYLDSKPTCILRNRDGYVKEDLN